MIYILMATYNGQKYLKSQIESLINQTYKEWKLLIRDDGSTDGTMNIILEFVNKYPGQIEFINNETPTGSAKANFIKLIQECNKMFELTDNDYFMFCDQDDVWNEDKILTSLQRLNTIKDRVLTEPQLVYSDLRLIDEQGTYYNDSFRNVMGLPKDFELSQLIIQNFVVGCTVMFNKRLMDYLFDIDSNEILMHDHIAAIIAKLFGTVLYIDETLVDYRQHESNSVGASDTKSVSYYYGRFKSGKDKFKADMNKSYSQIGYLLKKFPQIKITREYRMLLEYWLLKNSNKLDKIKYYKKYNVYKSGTIKKIMQNIWA